MTLLEIRHRTAYHYRFPVQLQAHRLMLKPRSSPGLHLLDCRIRCEPDARLSWSADEFGNPVATASFSRSTSTLIIDSELQLEKTDANDALLQSPALLALPYPFSYPATQLRDAEALRQPCHGDLNGDLSAWARQHILASGSHALALLSDLNAGIHQHIGYRMRVAEGTHAPLQTLSLREGACRDLATLFIETARHLGFAARAVSGYVFDPDAPQASAEPGTTHAWAEVLLPLAGWVAFDPTHRRIGSRQLIPVAIARDITQIVPVSGGFIGSTSDFLRMDVEVRIRDAGRP